MLEHANWQTQLYCRKNGRSLRSPSHFERRYFLARQYPNPPAMQIDPNKKYAAILHTVKGDIKIELFAAQAPVTVNNFVFLARDGFYNETTFQRVIGGFMVQRRDPTPTCTCDPGFRFN